MGIPVLILGESGSGKSTSLRNFEPEEILIINTASKPLPFRKKMNTYNCDFYEDKIIANESDPSKGKRIVGVKSALSKTKAKSIAVDDCQYLMSHYYMRKRNETGYQKFTDIAGDFFDLIEIVKHKLPKDTIVYFMAHIETDSNTGKSKMKTVGKMLDSMITLEGEFTIVLRSLADDGRYIFRTQSNNDTAKSPMEMFSLEIENDLKFVDTTIREYWGMEIDKNAKTTGI